MPNIYDSQNFKVPGILPRAFWRWGRTVLWNEKNPPQGGTLKE